ncbi:tyrosine-type recombinase/integrase [Streptomyces sp. NPDC020096]
MLKKVVRAADLVTPDGGPKCTPYALQHFFASAALTNGIPIHEVSRGLGHKSIKTTVDIYGQIAFIFDGGTLNEEQAADMRPHDEELSEVAFLSPDRAGELLRSRLRARVALQALTDGRSKYLNDARPLW